MVNKLKYNKYICVVGFLLTVSCKYIDDTYKYKKIDSNAEINIIVNNVEPKNGFIINNEYYYGGGIFLQKNNNYPKWIMQEIGRENNTVIFDKNGQLLLDIWKIKTPYNIYKKAHSNVLYLVKNNDTLQFRTL